MKFKSIVSVLCMSVLPVVAVSAVSAEASTHHHHHAAHHAKKKGKSHRMAKKANHNR